MNTAELRDMYWWQREAKDHASAHPVRRFGGVLYTAWSFFVTPWYSIPIVLLLLSRDRHVLVCCGMLACALIAGVLYPFFGLLLNPIIAGVAMSLSSVSVISNALRLRRIKL